ncbi:hypothetical protein OS493_017873 [Desmophyllum pertusum]|uniref:PH domain-containing protein n=1 Tax=Desmophyllum pertusum TaxID=174260 RepID=A0A9W9YZX4_9CNID|nr:hypothetical protein OS493_017873 [Desmophyllum pertusum]
MLHVNLKKEKERRNQTVFALGPVFDNFAKRTYYISCESADDKLSWMEVVNAATESQEVPQDKFDKGRKSVRQRLNRRSSKNTASKQDPVGSKEEVCLDPLQRIEKWTNLCQIINCRIGRKLIPRME